MAHMTSVHFDDRTDALLDAFTQSHGVSRSTFIQEAVAEKLGGGSIRRPPMKHTRSGKRIIIKPSP